MHINRLFFVSVLVSYTVDPPCVLVLLSPCPRDVLGWKCLLCVDVILVIHCKLLTRLRCGLSVRCYYAGPLIAADIHLPTKAITFPITGLTSVSGFQPVLQRGVCLCMCVHSI